MTDHRFLSCLYAVVALVAVGPALAQPRPSDAELASMLRAGGYVIVIRHGATNDDQADTDPLHPDNIAQQRQLASKGEQAAKALGSAIKQIGVPVGKVISSQFNRAYQTARLAGLESAEKSADVSEGGLVVSTNENRRRAAALRKLVSTPPQPGTNTIVVTHRPNLMDAFGKDWFDVKEGETTIFKPDGSGFSVAARFEIDQWPRMAAAAAQK
jgi:phosphohistidine phosphatase SixA